MQDSKLPEGTFLKTLLVADLIGSTDLVRELGDRLSSQLFDRFDRRSRKLLREHDGHEIDRTDGFLFLFERPTSAVLFALEHQRALVESFDPPLEVRIGIHLGEVILKHNRPEDVERGAKLVEVEGLAKPICGRLMSLAQGRQLLLSGPAYELARRGVEEQDREGKPLRWLEHGAYHMKGLDEPVEIFQVGEQDFADFSTPPDSKKVRRIKDERVTHGGSTSERSSQVGRWWLAGTLLAVIAGVWLGRGLFIPDSAEIPPATPSTAAVNSETPSIAVLPFVDMSPEKDQEYFSDGLTEELLNTLAKNRSLKVVGRTSSFSFKGKDEDLRVIGANLNVASILEGSVRKAGNQVRITAQLINVADGFHLWSESYDRELKDIFALQEEIARAVAEALQVTLLGEEAGVTTQVIDPAAYTAYLQGRHFRRLGRSEAGLEKAAGYLEQALEIAPDYAPAWAGLAAVRSGQAGQGYLDLDAGYAQARQAAERALELDPNRADAQVELGSIKLEYDWDWQGADAALQRGLELEPNNPDVLRLGAELAGTLGRLEEGLTLSRRRVELDPLQSGAHARLGRMALGASRLDEAERATKKALELNPGRAAAHKWLGLVYLRQGRLPEALEEMQREPAPIWQRFGLALVYHASGRQEEADAELTELIKKYQDVAAYQIAEVYADRGEVDKAFEWLERAYQQRDPGLTGLKISLEIKSLHSDPRWGAFLKKMKLDG